MEIRDWQKAVYKNAKAHGFYTRDYEIPELLCLIYDEISEAFQGWQKADFENFTEELADVVLMTLSVCGYLKIDLQTAMERKHETNKARPWLHGGKIR